MHPHASRHRQGSLWLIDFAKAGVGGLFTDAVKVVGVLLFEHFPMPLTLAELRATSVQKLVDALQETDHAPPPACVLVLPRSLRVPAHHTLAVRAAHR